MSQPDEFDIFVSYARKDNLSGYVSRVLKEILQRHREFTGGRELAHFFDRTNIENFSSWESAILHKGINKSRLFLAFLSPNYFNSDVCRWEWNAWLDREISLHILGEGAAPIYFIEVPGMYASPMLSEQEVANEIAKLCQRNPDAGYVGEVSEAVKEARRRQLVSPYLESDNLVLPFFQQGVTDLQLRDVEDVLFKLARHLEMRSQEVIAAAHSDNEVPAYNKNFTGRRTELLRVRDSLKADQTGVVAGIQGLGGIGKTELAYTYAHAFAGVYPGGRYHIPCENKNSLTDAIFQLSDYAAFRPQISDEERKLPKEHFAAILRVLKQRSEELGPILLVLDNVTHPDLLSPATLEPLTHLQEKLHLLATTREVPRANRNWITLGELSRKEALALLARFHRFDEDATEQAAAETIVTKLGGFALALELLGAFLEVTPSSNYADWAETIGLDDLDLLAEETNFELRRHQHERRLAEILGPTLKRLSPEQQRVMQYAAFLPADLVPLPWLKSLLLAEFPNLGTADRLKRDPWEVLVDHPVRLGLLTRVNETETNRRHVRVHRLVQELVRKDLSAKVEEQILQALNAHIRMRVQELDQTTSWKDARWELEPLDALAWRWYERNDPDTAWLTNEVGHFWHILSEWPKAEPLKRRALADAEQAYGTEDPRVAIRLNNLAALLHDMNRLAEAEPLMRRALAIEEQSYGPNDPRVASSLINLAALLAATNRLAEAELLLRRALAMNELSCEALNPSVARGLNSLSQLLQATNRLAEAEPLLRRALVVDEHCYGPDQPRVAVCLNNLALLLKATNRLAEAEPLMRRALAIDEHYYAAVHPLVANRLNNLAALLKETYCLAEAEALMRRGLAIEEKFKGTEHPHVAIQLNNLAELLQDTNRLGEAEPLMRRALTIFALVLTNEHPNTLVVCENYRRLLTDLELSTEEIEERVETAIAAQDLGPDKAVAEAFVRLDEQYREEGRSEIHFLKPDQAITPHLERLLLPKPLSLNYQGLSALQAGSHAQAAALFEAADELNDSEADATELKSVIRLNRGVALRELGGLELASKELSAVIAEMKRDENQPDPLLGRCLFHLAKCQYELGETSKAIETIEQSLRAFENATVDHPVPPRYIEQSQLLHQILQSKTPPPPRVEIDIEAELSSARNKLKAMFRLNSHPLNQAAGELLDQMLGPAASTAEVLTTLDEQYRREGKPPVYFLSLDEPFTPHLDELLGAMEPSDGDTSDP